MKKISAIALTLVLTALIFTGCRTANDMVGSTGNTIMPTVTEPSTIPTTEATIPTTEVPTDVTTTPTDGMIDPTDNPAENGTDDNPATGDRARQRDFRGIR